MMEHTLCFYAAAYAYVKPDGTWWWNGTSGSIGIAKSSDGITWTDRRQFLKAADLPPNVAFLEDPYHFTDIDGKRCLYFTYYDKVDEKWKFGRIQIAPAVRNVAIVDVASSKSVVGQGYSMNINVTVENQGSYTETFNVTLYANTTAIDSKQITLTSLNSTTITFTWNTSGFAKGNYTIWAYAWPVQGETEIADNALVDGSVKVTMVGDIDGDVDMDDIGWICYSFGSKPKDPKYNPNRDIDCNGIIDMDDIGYACLNYGKRIPKIFFLGIRLESHSYCDYFFKHSILVKVFC
jgi:hypothetical protein